MTLAVRQIYPVQGQDLPIPTDPMPGQLPPAVAELASLYRNVADRHPAGRPWLRANMVASTDGSGALAGRSGGLSGPGDRMIFNVLRSLADVILVGAGTARTERYRPASASHLWAQLRPKDAPPPPIAVVTTSLNLADCDQLLGVPACPSQTIVITTTAAPAARKTALAGHARIIEAGDRTVDIGAAISALADLGHASILTEGGPTLLGQLADTGLLDELCLTISPILATAPACRIVARHDSRTGGTQAAGATVSPLALAHVLTDESFLFSRYLREGPVADAQG